MYVDTRPNRAVYPTERRGARVVEGARLESVCAVPRYRGFESHPLRIMAGPVASDSPANLIHGGWNYGR